MKQPLKDAPPERPNRFGIALIVAIVLLLPLSAALYYSGVEWLLGGFDGVPKEFVTTYVLGAVGLIGAIAVAVYKDRKKKK